VAFDALSCFVWIDPYESAGPRDVGARGAGALCTRHADRLVPPRGWAVQDRRSPAPALWSDRPVPEAAPGARSVRRADVAAATASPAAVAIDAPLPFDAPASQREPVRVVTSAGPVAEPSEREDIEALLAHPTGPLLSRAFDHARGPQPD
jgi:hypothetical protein